MSNPSATAWCVFSLLAAFAILLPAKANSSFDSAPLGMAAKSRTKRGEPRVTSHLASRIEVTEDVLLRDLHSKGYSLTTLSMGFDDSEFI